MGEMSHGEMRLCPEQIKLITLNKRMDEKLKKLDKIGYITKRRYYALQGTNMHLKLELEGFLNGHRIKANTEKVEQNIPILKKEFKTFPWTKQRLEKSDTSAYLKIDGITQPNKVRKDFLKKYTKIAYDLDLETELEIQITKKEEAAKKEKEEERYIEITKKILF